MVIMELKFEVTAEWSGVAREGEGAMQLGNARILYSAPANMGGKGVGTSPEEFLLAAVTSCYSGTLMRVLTQLGLPGDAVEIHTEGRVDEFPNRPRFAQITVHPKILQGDENRHQEYQEAAQVARDRCFIGRTVRDYLDYAVGQVSIG